MVKKIVIINGLGGCGKSTFAYFCRAYAFSLDCAIVTELSSIDYVKRIAKLLGWDGQKDQAGRVFLHDLKKAMEKYNDRPNQEVIKTIAEREKKHPDLPYIFFVNIREKESILSFISKLEKKGYNKNQYMTLLIKNSLKESNEVPELVDEINNFTYDKVIYNEGTIHELQDKAEEFIKSLL